MIILIFTPPPNFQLEFSSKKFNLRLKIRSDSNCALFCVPFFNHIFLIIFFISFENVEIMPTFMIFCSKSRRYDAQKNENFTFCVKITLFIASTFFEILRFYPKYSSIITKNNKC